MKIAHLVTVFASCFLLTAPLNLAKAQTVADKLEQYLTAGVGMIAFFAAPTGTPRGWLECNGDAKVIAQYPELATVIGNTYGAGEPADSTFRVPDMKGNVIIGFGASSAARGGNVGTVVGSETSTAPFSTSNSGAEHFYSTRDGNLENPHTFDHSTNHNHTGSVTVSTVQPSMILRCFIKAKP